MDEVLGNIKEAIELYLETLPKKDITVFSSKEITIAYSEVNRLTSQETEKLLYNAGFELVKSKDSYRIYMKRQEMIIIPFHGGKILHPKVIKQILKSIGNEN